MSRDARANSGSSWDNGGSSVDARSSRPSRFHGIVIGCWTGERHSASHVPGRNRGADPRTRVLSGGQIAAGRQSEPRRRREAMIDGISGPRPTQAPQTRWCDADARRVQPAGRRVYGERRAGRGRTSLPRRYACAPGGRGRRGTGPRGAAGRGGALAASSRACNAICSPKALTRKGCGASPGSRAAFPRPRTPALRTSSPPSDCAPASRWRGIPTLPARNRFFARKKYALRPWRGCIAWLYTARLSTPGWSRGRLARGRCVIAAGCLRKRRRIATHDGHTAPRLPALR